MPRNVPRHLHLRDLALPHHVPGDLAAFGGTILQPPKTLLHLPDRPLSL
jgi:hypothetical protein